jgi:hypothetical protein
VTPYFQTPDCMVTIFHARWEDVVAAGVIKMADVALIHDDPEYGVKERTKRASAGRTRTGAQRGKLHAGASVARDFPAIVGDDKPYDPAPILALDKPTVTWGANHYASRLSDSPSWLEWDKREDTTSDDNADFELAWTNLGGPARKFRHLWRGLCRASETGGQRLHATQKPESLSAFVFDHAMNRKKLKRGDLIFVPRMGSGPCIRPAQAIGCRIVLCEVVQMYCETAVNARLKASVRQADVPGGLFGARA